MSRIKLNHKIETKVKSQKNTEPYTLSEKNKEKNTYAQQNREKKKLQKPNTQKNIENKKNINIQYDKIIRTQIQEKYSKTYFVKNKAEKKNEAKPNLKARAKLIVASYVAVSALTVTLIIYNIFAISSINSSINLAKGNISAEQIKIENIVNKINDITSDSNIDVVASALGFSQIDSSQIINVPLYEKQALPTYEEKSNWFDSIVSFLKNLF